MRHLKFHWKGEYQKVNALHAIVARDNGLILITRDNHFRVLQDISKYYKPEELI